MYDKSFRHTVAPCKHRNLHVLNGCVGDWLFVPLHVLPSLSPNACGAPVINMDGLAPVSAGAASPRGQRTLHYETRRWIGGSERRRELELIHLGLFVRRRIFQHLTPSMVSQSGDLRDGVIFAKTKSIRIIVTQ